MAQPPLLVAPTAALPRPGQSTSDLLAIDGSRVALSSNFQRPETLSPTLSAIFYAVPSSTGFPLASREEAVAGESYFLIGHPDTLGCGQGWVVNRVRLEAFGAGDELIFAGAGYSAGAAIVTSTGGLLAIATSCEAGPPGPLPAADASGEPVRLAEQCAIIGSRIPTP